MVDRSDDRKASFQRIEVMTDAGRRRAWSPAEKAGIVLESFEDGAVVAEIARRRGVRAQQIHGWRREAREGRLALPAEDERTLKLAFAPVVVDEALGTPPPPSPAVIKQRDARALPPISPPVARAPIEIEAAGVVVRIAAGADAHLAASLLRVMRERA
jgi:transposase